MEEAKAQKKRKWWKLPAIITGTIVGLILIILIAIPLVLTPERLTRWVREYGSEYLVNGRVDVSKVDLSVWSTFPHAVVEIDSLKVNNLSVPEEFRTVVACRRIEGRLNLAALLIGRISVGHALLDRPEATLWFGADSTQSSLSFLPPSEPKTDNNEPLTLPDLRINRFLIGGDARFRYVSERDSTDAAIILRQTALYGIDSIPEYTLNFDGKVRLPHALLAVDSLKFAADGAIGWHPSEPMAVELADFSLAVDSIETVTSLKADFSDGMRFDALKFRLLPMPLQRLASLLPGLPEVETPALAIARLELLKPYTYNPDTLLMPDLRAEFMIGDAPVSIPAYFLNLRNVGVEVAADISDRGLDASTIELKRLNIKFPASDFTIQGTATNIATDPLINGCFRGDLNFTNLNPRLWPLLGMRLRGSMNADLDFNAYLSDLSVNGFHRARLRGDARLNNFVAIMPADSLAAGARTAHLRFGSASGFKGIDSLLMASLTIDTVWTALPGMRAGMKDLALAVGVKNLDTLGDSTVITPMGGKLTIKALTFTDADSTRARARNVEGSLSLRRHKGSTRAPRLGARLQIKRLGLGSGPTLMSLNGIEIAAEAHKDPKAKRQHRRVLSAADSARRAARRDSILLAESTYESLDLGVDRSAVRMLKRWNLTGNVKARRGGVYTPLFPLRMRLKNLNLEFAADSLNLRSLNLQAGRSDLSATGSITNIQKALGRRHATSPLRLNLNLMADTINVNQLTRAAFQGAAYASKADSINGNGISLDLDAENIKTDTASEEMMAIVVPMNVDATVEVAAKNIIYSTLALNDFHGKILVANGAANLSELHAASPIGSVDLNMLYYAPTLADVNFGIGLDLHRFNIGRVTEILPTLDSIMPILNTLGGIVDVGISATTPVDSMLNIDIPKLRALVQLSGDSLRVLDEKTFKTVSKWLFFHDKKKNLIDHMDVKLTVEDNRLSLYPFMFDFDRYRIGVMGHNDMDMNLNYHVSILKSPIPFRFGVNVKGNVDKMKIRLGRARFKENMAAETSALADTVRLNLAREISSVFKRGANAARLGPLDVRRPEQLPEIDETADTLTPDEINLLPPTEE